jgi:hypothetical protein
MRFSNADQTAKFRKLMGMKEDAAGSGADGSQQQQQRQDQIFRDLDKQYSAARTVTHTARGSGLGFGN